MKPSTVQAFDLESASLPPELLEQFKPEFRAPANYKDEAKIKESIAEQESKWIADCALHAHTGRILCIGITIGLASIDVIHAGTEADILTRFWHWLELNLAQSITVTGFNCFAFDLPYAIRRSHINSVEVPKLVRKGRYWNDDLFDAMDAWRCGNYDQRISLDNMAKAFGFGGKTGNGAEFGKLWVEDRNKAIEYCKHDVMLVRKCAERMLGLKPTPKEFPHLKPVETNLVDVPIP